MNNNLREKYLLSLRSKGYSELATENISQMCDNVTERMLNTYGQTNSGAGLLVGEVQSGKTSNFIALTLDVIDKKMFDIIVILGGVIKDLKNQTKERLDAFASDGEFETIDIKTGAIKQIPALKQTIENSEEPYVIVCLKEKANLDSLNLLLNNMNKKILIIDDESDQATPNNEKTKVNEYGEREVSSSLSRIHESIDRLKNSTTRTFLLLVTATPYSNILASSNYNISPKWGYVLETSEGYCGLDSFHQEYGDYRDEKIRTLPHFINRETGKVDRLKANLSEASLEETAWFNRELRNSIISFVVGNVAFNIIEEKKKNFEMLIHSHFRKNDHKLIEEEIINYFESWNINREDDEYSLKIMGIDSEFDNFIKQLPLVKREKANNARAEIIEGCFVYLKNFNKKISIQINNSNNETDKEYTNIINKNKDIIIIGADKIQRGITFENLRVVFMPRLAIQAQADTILQRARWFGYRGSFFEYMTIFLTKRLVELFQSYVDVKEEINGFLKRNYRENINLRNIEKFIIVPSEDRRARLTRKGINLLEGNAQVSNTSIQKTPVRDEEIESKEIFKLINSGYDNSFLKSWKFITREVLIEDVNKTFLTAIFNKLEYIGDVETFFDYCNTKNLNSITFTFMNFNESQMELLPRKRSLNGIETINDPIEYSTISNLHSGRNSDYHSSKMNHNDKYAGDANILDVYISQLHENPNELSTLEIQVHKIQPMFNKNKFGDCVYMYSLKLPNEKEIAYIKTSEATLND